MPADRNFILSCLAGSLQNSPESSESFPNHFDSGPALDPRSKIQDCPQVLRGQSWIQCSAESSESFPNHFDSGPALDPRSKIAQGSCQGILDPTLTRWIQDSLARPLGNLGSWILDPGPGPNQNDSEMIRMIRLSIGSKIARAKPLCNLGSWILDPGPNDSDDSISLLLIRHLYCHDSYNIWSFMKYASHYIPQNTF